MKKDLQHAGWFSDLFSSNNIPEKRRYLLRAVLSHYCTRFAEFCKAGISTKKIHDFPKPLLRTIMNLFYLRLSEIFVNEFPNHFAKYHFVPPIYWRNCVCFESEISVNELPDHFPDDHVSSLRQNPTECDLLMFIIILRIFWVSRFSLYPFTKIFITDYNIGLIFMFLCCVDYSLFISDL